MILNPASNSYLFHLFYFMSKKPILYYILEIFCFVFYVLLSLALTAKVFNIRGKYHFPTPHVAYGISDVINGHNIIRFALNSILSPSAKLKRNPFISASQKRGVKCVQNGFLHLPLFSSPFQPNKKTKEA